MKCRGLQKTCIVLVNLVVLASILVWLHMSKFAANIPNLDHPERKGTDPRDSIKFEGRTPLAQCPPDEFFILPSVTLPYEKAQQLSFFDKNSPPREYSEKVLILTPVSNSANYLQHYFSILCSLTYPHHLLSVAVGEDSSLDKTFALASRFANRLSEKHFRRVEAFHLSDKLDDGAVFSRHDPSWQLRRRGHLARSRNELLMRGLDDEDWVLWIDSDVKYVPPDLVQHLLSAGGDIVSPSCLYLSPSGDYPIYDRNTWQETEGSRQFLAAKDPNYLMLEGYDATRRKYLPHLRDKGRKVPLDGVGGCTLLVRAQCHRAGLVFPSFVFEHHIETEGLAKLAKRMNYTVMGLPSVNVFHR